MEEFKKELENLINKYSIENECDMPDFLLSEMIVNIIKGVSKPIKKCLDWHGCNSICHPIKNKSNINIENIIGIPFLKFRVWSKKDKKMSFYKNKEIFDYIYNNQDKIIQNKVTITQYTGINTKDKKEIYVGDIIYWPHIDNEDCIDEIVIWNEAEQSFVCDKSNGDPGYWVDSDCLIKGNIFEN